MTTSYLPLRRSVTGEQARRTLDSRQEAEPFVDDDDGGQGYHFGRGCCGADLELPQRSRSAAETREVELRW
jgi:hypothetical protein